MTINSISEAVDKIAAFYADAEQKAQQIEAGARDLKDAWVFLASNAPEGDANNVIGGIESLHWRTRLVAAAAQFRATIYEMHADDTRRAQERGVDLPGIAGGGGR